MIRYAMNDSSPVTTAKSIWEIANILSVATFDTWIEEIGFPVTERDLRLWHVFGEKMKQVLKGAQQ